MGFGLNDIGSCFCKDDSKDGKGNNNIFIWVLVILVLLGCGGSGFIGGCNPCAARRDYGAGSGFGSGSWIIIAIILLCLCGNNGISGLGGQSGNLNTNIINLEREEYEDDYY